MTTHLVKFTNTEISMYITLKELTIWWGILSGCISIQYKPKSVERSVMTVSVHIWSKDRLLTLLIWFHIVNLKNKAASYFTAMTAKWFYWRIAESCSLEQASYGGTIGKSKEQRREACFCYVVGGNWEGLFWTKIHWRKTKFSMTASSYSCIVAGARRDLPPLKKKKQMNFPCD